MARKILLVCGILSSLLYVAMLVVVAMRWEGYSSVSQTVSELSAIGAPTRALWAVPGAFYTALVTAFGWGVWESAGRSRALRIVGASIAAYGALGLIWPFAPMHLRETIAAGCVPNTPEQLRAWVRDPAALKPGALMPAMQLDDRRLDALVAYLLTLR